MVLVAASLQIRTRLLKIPGKGKISSGQGGTRRLLSLIDLLLRIEYKIQRVPPPYQLEIVGRI